MAPHDKKSNELRTAPFRVSVPGKRICFWGAQESAALDPPDPAAQLAKSGANSGNIFIGAGLFRNTVCAHKEYHPGFTTMSPQETTERYDAIFIPASNFVSRSVDLTQAYDYLVRTKLPITCFGLGSQFLPTDELVLNPGTERMLRLMSERCGSIGVRGAFTADLLHGMGIRNVSLIGCPSLMSLTGAALDDLQMRRPQTLKVGINFSNNVRRHALHPQSLTATENALFRYMMFRNSYYVLQNEDAEMELLASAQADRAAMSKAAAIVAGIFEVGDLEPIVSHYLAHRLRMFFDVDTWISAMRGMTAVVGTRFHGNVAGLLAGTPALFLAHDMRTRELCELFRLPCLVIDRAYSADEVAERLTSVDYAAFAGNMRAIHTEWRLFMARNGMPADLP